jgi:hypothetical protein
MSDESAKTAKIGAFCYQNATKTRATNLLQTDSGQGLTAGDRLFLIAQSKSTMIHHRHLRRTRLRWTGVAALVKDESVLGSLPLLVEKIAIREIHEFGSNHCRKTD